MPCRKCMIKASVDLKTHHVSKHLIFNYQITKKDNTCLPFKFLSFPQGFTKFTKIKVSKKWPPTDWSLQKCPKNKPGKITITSVCNNNVHSHI